MRKLFTAIMAALLTMLVVVTSCTSENLPTATPPSPVSQTGAPAKLVFITQPGGSAAGSALSTQPVVAIADSDGKTVTSSTLPVKLVLTSGTSSGAALLGPSTMNAVNGVARFSDLFVDKAGTGYTITASCSTLASATSAAFNNPPGAAAELIFTMQPSGGIAGIPFTTQPQVIVQDNYGNKVPDYKGSVTMGITHGSEPTEAILSGTTTVNVVDGVARFTDLSINVANPPPYTLTATSGSLASATSNGFVISAGKPAKLEFTVQPAGAKVAEPFETQPRVAIEDSQGNVVTSSRDDITLSITPATGTAGANLSGTKTLTARDAEGGLAEFTDLSIDRVGSGYTLTATSSGLAPATSQPFDVTAP